MDLFLTVCDKGRLAYWLTRLGPVPGLEHPRYLLLKHGLSDHVTLGELARVGDALYPRPLTNVVWSSSFRVTEVSHA